jgi:hypothetical protein
MEMVNSTSLAISVQAKTVSVMRAGQPTEATQNAHTLMLARITGKEISHLQTAGAIYSTDAVLEEMVEEPARMTLATTSASTNTLQLA